MYRLYGMAAVFLFVLGAAAFSALNRVASYKPDKASVFLIERKCDIIETATTFDGKKSSLTYNGDCKSVDDWEKAKEKHDKTISAKAVVKVSYTAPQDGSSQTSQLTFTSRDDEFYDLKAGDEIDVLVSNSDPTKITRG